MPRFSDTLLDHARAPRNSGAMLEPDATGKADLDGRAPRVFIYLKAKDGAVSDAGFQALGCGVTIACCSVLTELVKGRPLTECRNLTPKDVIDALDGVPSDKQFCADLAIKACKAGLGGLS